MTLLEQLRQSAALCTAERLEAIPHVTLPLVTMSGDNVERADVTLWAGVDDEMAPQITAHVEPGFGKQGRFIDMQPADARKFAQMLITMATEVEEILKCSALPKLVPVKDD